jgi:ATP-dependent Clp protease adaptor protein ClpS
MIGGLRLAPDRDKYFAGLVFLQFSHTCAGLAHRLLNHYDVASEITCLTAIYLLRMPENAMSDRSADRSAAEPVASQYHDLCRFRVMPAESMADDDKKRRQDNGNKDNKDGRQDGPGTAVITKTRPQTKRPNMYRVLLLNDDYTPMEFVVHVLERFFNKDREAATQIMLHVHHHGIGECGIYTYEVAETKVTQVMDFARKHHHPLQCVMEKK